MYRKNMFTFYLIIVVCRVAHAVCPAGYNATPPSNYCYQRHPPPAVFSYETFTQICAIGGTTLPYYPTQAVYANFFSFWLNYADFPNTLLAYQHKAGVASFSDIGSTLDDQLIGWGNPFAAGEPSSGFGETCVHLWNSRNAWNDIPCNNVANIPICQTQGVLDNTFVTTPCSPLCQASSTTAGRLFSTSLLRCQHFGTVDATAIGYALTVPIFGTTETVYEMRNTAGKTIIQYGQTAAQNALNLNYTVYRAFFVATSVIATQTDLYILFRNSSNKTDSETKIVLKNSTTYVTLVGQSWIQEASFYLFTQMSSYSCSMVLDCQYTSWTAWSACIVGSTTSQTRTRIKTITEARNGTCDNILSQTILCPPQNCTYNPWTTWSVCSATCNNGTQSRIRTKNVTEAFGGVCDNIFTQTQTCLIINCPINCTWNVWQAWSACSTTCDSGIHSRVRTKTISEAYGGVCDNNSTDTQTCLIISCPIDCTWEQWTQWSQCTVSCDGGIQTRNRVKNITEANGGSCDNIYDGNQTCNSQFCLFTSPAGVAMMNATGLTDALADSASVALTIEDSVPYMMSSMTTDEKKQMGFQPSDNIIKCIYDHKQCNSTRDFKLIYDPSMGNCFTFNYPIGSFYTAKRAGDSNGLTILLYTYQDDYLCSTTRAGFRVLLHDPVLSPFVDNIGIQIRPGYLTSLFVSQVKTVMQPPPYGSCYSGENNNKHPYYYEGNYSTEGCIRSCFQASVIKSCGCGDPRYPIPPNTAYCDVSQKQCIEKMSNCEDEMDRSSCNCPTSCTDTQFFPIITNARLYNSPMLVDYCSGQTNEALDDCMEHARKDFAILEISFQTLKTISYEEKTAYSLIQLFNDASNVAGLILGMGMIIVPEVLILFYNFCSAICCRRLMLKQ